ncbi:hypothetical protein AB5N19_12037 [Seiridium cardinale]|uniref:Uncharacterized protein n=1 Tax=Seiridium cardinale TaxID=138064 RepID=A0ABR2XQH3_9PEZI
MEKSTSSFRPSTSSTATTTAYQGGTGRGGRRVDGKAVKHDAETEASTLYSLLEKTKVDVGGNVAQSNIAKLVETTKISMTRDPTKQPSKQIGGDHANREVRSSDANSTGVHVDGDCLQSVVAVTVKATDGISFSG